VPRRACSKEAEVIYPFLDLEAKLKEIFQWFVLPSLRPIFFS